MHRRSTAPQAAPLSGISDGPRWYRGRIRTRGPFVAVLPPLIAGLAALAFINVGDSTATGVAGLLTGTWAAPGLLAVGAPLSSSSTYPVAVAGSAVFWILVGLIAARRATRNPMADWRDFWRHYAWSAFGVFVGVAGALAAVGWLFGRELL